MLLVQFHCTITINQECEVSAYSTHNILRSGLKIPDQTFFTSCNLQLNLQRNMKLNKRPFL